MPIPKLNITNPEAIELIRKIKSREIFIPYIVWFKKYRWYFISALVVLVLIGGLALGKKLSEKTAIPVYVPPTVENVSPTQTTSVKSTFSGLKTEIQNLNTDLPDPVIPQFDNNITLEQKTPQ